MGSIGMLPIVHHDLSDFGTGGCALRVKKPGSFSVYDTLADGPGKGIRRPAADLILVIEAGQVGAFRGRLSPAAPEQRHHVPHINWYIGEGPRLTSDDIYREMGRGKAQTNVRKACGHAYQTAVPGEIPCRVLATGWRQWERDCNSPGSEVGQGLSVHGECQHIRKNRNTRARARILSTRKIFSFTCSY